MIRNRWRGSRNAADLKQCCEKGHHRPTSDTLADESECVGLDTDPRSTIQVALAPPSRRGFLNQSPLRDSQQLRHRPPHALRALRRFVLLPKDLMTGLAKPCNFNFARPALRDGCSPLEGDTSAPAQSGAFC
jgi:hypothetical protein